MVREEDSNRIGTKVVVSETVWLVKPIIDVQSVVGGFYYVASDILDLRESLAIIDAEVSIQLMTFSQDFSNADEVCRSIEQEGYRPVLPSEGLGFFLVNQGETQLAFLGDHPRDLQPELLGPENRILSPRRICVLPGPNKKLILALRPMAVAWDLHWKYPVVKL